MKYRIKRRFLWRWLVYRTYKDREKALWNLQYLRDLYPRRRYNLFVEDN